MILFVLWSLITIFHSFHVASIADRVPIILKPKNCLKYSVYVFTPNFPYCQRTYAIWISQNGMEFFFPGALMDVPILSLFTAFHFGSNPKLALCVLESQLNRKLLQSGVIIRYSSIRTQCSHMISIACLIWSHSFRESSHLTKKWFQFLSFFPWFFFFLWRLKIFVRRSKILQSLYICKVVNWSLRTHSWVAPSHWYIY